jgi:hypothetical protein
MSGPPPTSDAGRIQLAAHVAAREKDYEVIAQMRDADGSMLDRALEVVQKFIVERGLILFGGQAIDCALRTKGAQIYPDAQRPDFDFFSPRSVDDAYDLAERLAGMGFVGVGAVRAIHVQTMKVRVDSRWVADVGHIPLEVFDSVPTFDYRGMRAVHPDFQRMDMHLAFCFPFNAPPREDVFHRWRKDLRRINLYEKYFPLVPREDPRGGLLAARRDAPPQETVRLRARVATPIVLADAALAAQPLLPALSAALHGFAAYAILRGALDDLSIDSPRIRISFPDAATVELELPADVARASETIVFASPRPADIIGDGSADLKWYDPYIDVYPESVRSGAITVLSTEGRLLAASYTRVRVGDAGEPNGEARVVTPQYLLLWFLFEAHRAATTAHRTLYRTYYAHTLTILREAEALFSARLGQAISGREGAVMDEFAASPFAPSITTIGVANTDTTYIIKMADNAEKARETLPEALGVRADAGALIKGLPPRGYYPGGGKPRQAFDYNGCILFRRAGQARS